MKFGRERDCDVLCVSNSVSRSHCLFTRVTEGLFMMDFEVNYFYIILKNGNLCETKIVNFQSTNGLFKNGSRMEPTKSIKLQVGDIIGIGCGQLSDFQEDMFIYKYTTRVSL